MPSLLQKAVMLSPVSFCFFIRSGIFGSFIIFYVLAEQYSAAKTEKRCTTPNTYLLRWQSSLQTCFSSLFLFSPLSVLRSPLSAHLSSLSLSHSPFISARTPFGFGLWTFDFLKTVNKKPQFIDPQTIFFHIFLRQYVQIRSGMFFIERDKINWRWCY